MTTLERPPVHSPRGFKSAKPAPDPRALLALFIAAILVAAVGALILITWAFLSSDGLDRSAMGIVAGLFFVLVESVLCVGALYWVYRTAQSEFKAFQDRVDHFASASSAWSAQLGTSETTVEALHSMGATLSNALIVFGIVGSATFLVISSSDIASSPEKLLSLAPKAFSATGFAVLCGLLVSLFAQIATGRVQHEIYSLAQTAWEAVGTRGGTEAETSQKILQALQTLQQSVATLSRGVLSIGAFSDASIVAAVQALHTEVKGLGGGLTGGLTQANGRLNTIAEAAKKQEKSDAALLQLTTSMDGTLRERIGPAADLIRQVEGEQHAVDVLRNHAVALGAMREQMGVLQDTLHNHSEALLTKHAEAVDALARQITTKIMDDMTRFGLEKAGHELVNLSQQLGQKMFEAMGKANQLSIENLNESLAKFQSVGGALLGLHQRLDLIVQSLAALEKPLTESGAQVSHLSAKFKLALDHFQRDADALVAESEQLRSSAGGVDQLFASMSATARSLSENAQSWDALSARLQENQQRLGKVKAVVAGHMRGDGTAGVPPRGSREPGYHRDSPPSPTLPVPAPQRHSLAPPAGLGFGSYVPRPAPSPTLPVELHLPPGSRSQPESAPAESPGVVFNPGRAPRPPESAPEPPPPPPIVTPGPGRRRS